MSEVSSFVFTKAGRTKGAACSMPCWKSSNPGAISGPTLTSVWSVGESGRASVTWRRISGSPAQMTAFMSAALAR